MALAYPPEHSPIDQIASDLGANGLPYALPIHPNLVHLTIGPVSYTHLTLPTILLV